MHAVPNAQVPAKAQETRLTCIALHAQHQGLHNLLGSLRPCIAGKIQQRRIVSLYSFSKAGS